MNFVIIYTKDQSNRIEALLIKESHIKIHDKTFAIIHQMANILKALPYANPSYSMFCE